MSFNGSGTFVINSSGQPVVANTVISSTVFNALTADLATGLSTCITKDGQTTPTANIPMGTFKFTGLGNGSAATDSATLGQVQASTTKLVTVTGSDTIAGTMNPALTAYASGQMFYFIAAGANTGAVTLNIDGLGARNVTRDGSTALAANDILSGEVALVVYDGTRFQLLNPANAGSMTVSNLTVTGTTTLSGLTASTALALDASKAVVSVTNTGTGNNVLATSPTLTTPNLGTPSAIVLTNASGTASININGTVGATTPNTGAFTTLSASSTVSGTGFTNLFASPPAIGATAANTGAFTNLSYTGTLTGGTGIVNIGSGQVYKDASGNVGIGTASPGVKLDVVGAIRATTNISAVQDFRLNTASFLRVADASPGGFVGGYNIKSDGGTGAVYDSTGTIGGYGVYLGTLTWYSGTSASAGTAAPERMRLDTSGNLGIGTASPGGRLHITTASGNTDFVHNVTGSGTAARTSYQRGGTVQFLVGLGAWSGTDTYQIASSTGPLTTLDASGNLGIGTTTMTSKLNVNGDIRTAGGGDLRLSNNGDPSITADDTFLYNDAKNLIVWTNGAERARIDSSGNLGIGTASPGARLHVAGESRFGLGAEAVRAAIGSAFAAGQGELFTTSTNSMGVGTAGAANLNFYSNSVLRMIIDSNGNVRTNTGALTTTATNGFLYVSTCAGTPTGTPTAITGMAPIVVDTTNNKMYFYSGGQWRDAGP